MTEPTPMPAPPVDPITAILLAVTRIEGNLAGALETLKRHDAQLVEVAHVQADHGNRLTALETRAHTDDGHAARTISSRMVFWAALSGIAVLLGAFITLIVALHP